MKDTTFKLRMDKKQLEHWKKKRKDFGLDSVAAFIRYCVEQILRGK